MTTRTATKTAENPNPLNILENKRANYEQISSIEKLIVHKHVAHTRKIVCLLTFHSRSSQQPSMSRRLIVVVVVDAAMDRQRARWESPEEGKGEEK